MCKWMRRYRWSSGTKWNFSYDVLAVLTTHNENLDDISRAKGKKKYQKHTLVKSLVIRTSHWDFHGESESSWRRQDSASAPPFVGRVHSRGNLYQICLWTGPRRVRWKLQSLSPFHLFLPQPSLSLRKLDSCLGSSFHGPQLVLVLQVGQETLFAPFLRWGHRHGKMNWWAQGHIG